MSAGSPGVVHTGVPGQAWYLGPVVECCDDLPGSRWTIAVEQARANLALTTNSAWIMRGPDNVVTANVLLDLISVVDLDASGGTM